MIYQLDSYILNPREMTLKDGATDALISDDEKLIAALTLLVERYPAVVAKEELIKTIWPRQIVTDWSLTRFISDMRKVLGDRHHIKTVHGRGYRYSHPVKEVKAADNDEPIVNRAAGNERVPASEAEGKQQVLSRSSEDGSGDTGRKRRRPAMVWALSGIAGALFIGSWLIFGLQNRSPTVPMIGPVGDIPVIAVLPAGGNGRPALQLGLMALLSEKLNMQPGVQLIQPQAVLTVLNKLKPADEASTSGTGDFDRICRIVACNRLISLEYIYREDRHSLRYTITSNGAEAGSRSFVAGHAMDAFNAMYADILTHLPAHRTEENAAITGYTDNREAYLAYAEALGAVADGDFARARTNLEYAVRADDDFFQARQMLAGLYILRNDIAAAEALLRQIETMTLTQRQAYILDALQANRRFARRQLDRSLEHAQRALATAEQLEDRKLIGDALLNNGIVRHARGEHEAALTAIARAKTLFIETYSARGLAQAEYCLAEVYDALRDKAAAEQAAANGNAVYAAAGLQGPRSCTPGDVLYSGYFFRAWE